MEAKTREETEKQRLAEEKKKKQLEYIQQLWDKVLAEDAALLEDAKESQIIKSKYKKVFPEFNKNHQPFKKAEEKQLARYCGDIGVKIGCVNPCERYMYTRQNSLVYNSR